MAKPYPKEFRDDVVRVARNREPGVELSRIAEDFGIRVTAVYTWMKTAGIGDGERPGTTRAQSAGTFPMCNTSIKVLHQYSDAAQANLPRK